MIKFKALIFIISYIYSTQFICAECINMHIYRLTYRDIFMKGPKMTNIIEDSGYQDFETNIETVFRSFVFLSTLNCNTITWCEKTPLAVSIFNHSMHGCQSLMRIATNCFGFLEELISLAQKDSLSFHNTNVFQYI